MKVRRARTVVAGGLLVVGVWASPQVLPGQGGPGAAGGGQAQTVRGPAGLSIGSLIPAPIDPGRPWGWAVRAFMDDPNQPLYNTTKQKLLDGRQVYSHTITEFDIDAYCSQAPNYDFTRFEMQHSTLRFDQVQAMVAACPRAGATPILRIPDALEASVQKAMDIGMLGIIIPTVDDATKARDAAIYARFPPTGRRSSGGGQAGNLWGPAVPQGRTFRQTINDNMLVIVMIETIEAVENALAIASQPGVDVVILGNADLASFSGYEPGSDGYQDLLTRVRDATYQAGKFWGNANPGFSVNNPLAADSRFHMGVPPARD